MVGLFAIGADLVVLDRIEGDVVSAPGQGDRDEYLRARGRLWKRIAANPGFAFLGVDVADGVEHRLTLVAQGRLDVIDGAQARHVLDRFHQFQFASHLRDLGVADRIEQILHEVDVVDINRVAGLQLAFGVHLNREQFVRVSLFEGAVLRHCIPHATEHTGAQDALRGLLHEMASAVVEVVLANMHLISPLSSD